MPMVDDEIVLLYAMVHHLDGCTVLLAFSLPFLLRLKGLLCHLVQLPLILQHQKFFLDLLQFL